MGVSIGKEIASRQRMTAKQLNRKAPRCSARPPTPRTASGSSDALPGGFKPSPRATFRNERRDGPRSWPATPTFA